MNNLNTILIGSSVASAGLSFVIGQAMPQYPAVSWSFVAASVASMMAVVMPAFFEYLKKRLDVKVTIRTHESVTQLELYRAKFGPLIPSEPKA